MFRNVADAYLQGSEIRRVLQGEKTWIFVNVVWPLSSVTALWKLDTGSTWMQAPGRDHLKFCHSFWHSRVRSWRWLSLQDKVSYLTLLITLQLLCKIIWYWKYREKSKEIPVTRHGVTTVWTGAYTSYITVYLHSSSFSQCPGDGLCSL